MDRPRVGYMKGFLAMCDTGRSPQAQRQQELMNSLEHLGQDLEEGNEVDLDDEVLEAFKKLPHYESIWGQGQYSSCGLGSQGGGWIGWHWKKEKYWKDAYDPTPEDLRKLKAFLKKVGLEVGQKTEDGIIAFEG